MKMVIATCLITLLTGCLSESDTGGVFNRVKDPVGTVSGLVQDTNGNALEGAIVSVAGQTKKTDAQGRYTFNNFPVSNVEGNDNDNNTNEAGPRINIYVAPPQNGDTAYLSATISVGPAQAEIDGTNVDGNGQIDTSANTIENGAVTFVDGFVIEAPVAQLPALDNTVTGFLVDNTTGLPIVGKLVYLNVNNPDTLGSNGLANHVTLQDVNIAANAVTSENGEFKIEKVPNDSALDLIVVGYTFEMVSANGGDPADITTRIEDNVYLGNVYMTSIVVGDDRPPVITDVNIHSTVDPNSIEGRNVARTIQITLSESIATTPTENSVFVNYVDNASDRTVYLELASAPEVNGANITINTVDDLIGVGLGTPLFVSFSRSDFADAAGNGLSVSQSNGNNCQDDNVGAFCEFLKPNNSAWLDMPIDTFALAVVATSDDIDPFVESIDGVIGGVTDPSVAATLVLRFNMPLQPIADDLMDHAVFVMIGPEGAADSGNENLMDYNDISFSLDEAGLSLTIELLGDVLPQNADVSVDLLQTAFRDEDDQHLMLNPEDVMESGFADDFVNGAVRVDLSTINSRQALAVELAILVEDDAENNPIPTHRALRSVTDDPLGQFNTNEAADRLTLLKNEIGLAGPVVTNRSLLTFALVPNAVAYELTAVNSLGAAINVQAVASPSRGLTFDGGGDQRSMRFQPDGTGQAPRILLTGVESGDTFSLAAIDGFNVRTLNGDSDTKTLNDNTPPATILQNSYSVGNSVVAQSNTVGAGGELVQRVGANENFGVPFYDVSPGLLGVLNGGTNSLRVTDLTNNGGKDELLAEDQADRMDRYYDENSYNLWSPVRTMGIAMSENVQFTDAPTRSLGALISGVGVSDWSIANDITTDDGNTLNSSDLLTLSANVISLASNEHNTLVNFNGLIMDLAGNEMENDNGSKVILRDRIPPMIIRAEYNTDITQNGDETVSLLIEFNEPINPESFAGVTIGGDPTNNDRDPNPITLPEFGDEDFEILTSNEAVTVTFDITNGRQGSIWENADVAFFELNINQVEDMHGNSWNDYMNSQGNFTGLDQNRRIANDLIPTFAVKWRINE